MKSESVRLGKISLDFAEISPMQDGTFPYKHVHTCTHTVSSSRRDRVFFNQLSFVCQMF